MAGNNKWLALVQEDIIEPELPIIDPHHHLWDLPDSRYLLDELLADMKSGHNIRGTVYVEYIGMHRADGPEHMKPVGETEFVNGVAAQSASGLYGDSRVAAGIVSFAQLSLGAAVDEVIEAHIAAAPKRLKGIRNPIAFDPDPGIHRTHGLPPQGLASLPAFREGFSRLAKYGLSYDAWLFHPQIGELTALARAFPETTIIFDHFGGPLGIGPYAGKRVEIFDKWMADVVELSECPNVVAKLGGINMKMSGFDWHEREKPPTSDELAWATQDYYLHTIDAFGPDRCMFESNFPVDRVSCSYHVLWNAFKKIVNNAGFNEAEKAAMFHDTASRVYRLDI